MLRAPVSHAEPATPGYPERVLQWTVQEAETCEDISTALYGSPTHVDLVERYNAFRCAAGKPLPKGATLVLPEKVTALAPASLRSVAPAVRARPAGGTWEPATAGMPLHRNDNVNTLAHARADIRFIDRTRVVLAEHTLVVIYGTAAETRVSRTAPSAVQLDEGEVEAGLAALGGRPVSVGVRGGGQVDAQSTDTVVRKKAKRATVSVYDGKAAVKSTGATVEVPARYGSSFEEAKPPTPPRPLPPAPAWTPDTTGGVVIALQGKASLHAAWQAVDDAAAYRVELAGDPEFHELIDREEVPATVHDFRGENLPAGVYYVRVRAIDREDFIGLTTAPLSFVLLGARPDGAAAVPPDGAVWHVNPYATLTFDPRRDVELSVDRAPWGPVPGTLDLAAARPAHLSFRDKASGRERVYDLQYEPVQADLSAHDSPQGGRLKITVRLMGTEGIDVASRVAPRLKLTGEVLAREWPLAFEGTTATALIAIPEPHGELSAHVLDRRGIALGSLTIPASAAPVPPPQRNEPVLVGVTAPFVPLFTGAAPWWTPSPRSGGVLAGGAAVTSVGTGAQVHASGVASFGRVAADVRLASEAMGEDVHPDSAGWLGARLDLGTPDGGHLTWGPALGVGLPMSRGSPPARAELGLAIGALHHRIGWLVNMGARARLESNPARATAPSSQLSLVGGVTYDIQPSLRLWSCLDSYLLNGDADPLLRAGLAGGVEIGRAWFGSAGLRASPQDDAGGWISMQLAAGARAW